MSETLNEYNFKNISDRAFFTIPYKTPQIIRRHPFDLTKTDNVCCVSLSPWVASINSTITCRKASTLQNMSSSFTEYKEVNHMPINRNEIFFDRGKSLVYFLLSEADVTDKVLITFEAIGQSYLNASMVAIKWNTTRPIMTLEQWVRKNLEVIDAVNDLGSAKTLVDQMNNYITSMTQTISAVRNEYPKMKTLSDKMKTQIPTAETIITSLESAIKSASSIVSRITKCDNAVFHAYYGDFYYDVDEKLWIQEITHNLASANIIWRVVDDKGREVFNMCENDPSNPTNVLRVKNDVRTSLTLIANRGYWGGLS